MILVDLNVVLDVVQRREPHYRASASVIDAVVRGQARGFLPAHAFPTIHFLVARYQNASTAARTVDWLLRWFEVAAVGRAELERPRALGSSDFEDAVVAAAAETAGCEAIVSRNVADFAASPVAALTPEEYLVSGAER